MLPRDAPFIHIPGPNPDRILLIGDAEAVAGGVTRHADALIGRLANSVSTRTGRGVVIDQHSQPDCGVADLHALAERARLERYDVVVIVPGSVDAESLLPEAAWASSIDAVVDRVRKASRDPFVVVCGPNRPARNIPRPLFRTSLVARRARAFNRAASSLAARTSAVIHVPTPSSSELSTADPFGQLAAALTDVLTPRLAAVAGADLEVEAERVDALTRTGLAGIRRDGRFDGLAAMAKQLMNADIAAVSFLDAESQWFHSMDGATYQSIPRSISLCNATVSSNEPVVYGDMHLDPTLDQHPLVHGDPPIRFYAGCAVESPDGYRIGTVCVFGVEPRDPRDVDVTPLQRLAAEARERIWMSVGAR